jgi:hypothetical protein
MDKVDIDLIPTTLEVQHSNTFSWASVPSSFETGNTGHHPSPANSSIKAENN